MSIRWKNHLHNLALCGWQYLLGVPVNWNDSAMTQTRFFRTRNSKSDKEAEPTTSSGGGAAMRVIVPLQGVVQGRGGVVLGSVIPCVLFYFLQLYLKRNRSDPTRDPPSSPEVDSSGDSSPSSSNQLVELSVLPRTLSRNFLSPRSCGPVCVSGRANSISRLGESSIFVGMRRFLEDPFDELDNPTGIIQLSVAENKVGGFMLFVGLNMCQQDFCALNFSVSVLTIVDV